MEHWAIFFNDTITIGHWSITPGIRYDHNSISDDFISPSIGVTYGWSEKTLIRMTCARGFNTPTLSILSGGGLFLDPNPDLDPEEVWSYQAGVETAAIPYCWLRVNLFYHDQDKALERQQGAGGPPSYNDLIVNGQGIDRKESR